jgi:hypothetical protein
MNRHDRSRRYDGLEHLGGSLILCVWLAWYVQRSNKGLFVSRYLGARVVRLMVRPFVQRMAEKLYCVCYSRNLAEIDS